MRKKSEAVNQEGLYILFTVQSSIHSTYIGELVIMIGEYYEHDSW
jgi:hypothetical protein